MLTRRKYELSLERLDLDYIDLMILHHSQPSNDVEAYQAMERAVADGTLHSIGLSNFYTPEDFDRLVGETDAFTNRLFQRTDHESTKQRQRGIFC